MTRIRQIAQAAAAALTVAYAFTAHAQDIKIGYTADQSGSGVAELGIAGRWGFEAAIEDLNKAGGVLGKKVVGVIRWRVVVDPDGVVQLARYNVKATGHVASLRKALGV